MYQRHKRTRKLTHTLLFGLLLFVAGTVHASKPTGRPNIIVMMVDDMGFAGPSIAPYGNPNYKTPGMDRLAREGMLFTDFHASGAICSATRAGLVTGRYQQLAGIEAVIHPHATHPEHRKGLQDDEITFAELFKAAGYSTGLVGKWHLGYAAETPTYHPMNHGFDYFMGYVSGNIDYINHWGDHMQHDWWHGRKETSEEGYTTHLINKYALEFIEQHKDKPFCLYVAHESPHSPVQGPNDPIQRGPGARKRTTPHSEAMMRMILEMDKGVEQVRAKLVELGLERNTLFLFFSDNGDAPGTATGSPRFRGHKGSVYEGGTRVPAVAWWPGRIKAGTRADDLSITLDVMPTILSVAGIAPPDKRALDGVDLSPALFEQAPIPARPLFWADLSNNGSRSEALRDGSWKLVVQHPRAKPGTFENETVELFNLDKDEGEKNNLADEQPERAAAMLARIKAWYADTQKKASPQPGGWNRKPRRETSFFSGKDLTGWKGNDGYWSVKENAIVGHSAENVPRNEFLWSAATVRDFHLVVDVKLTPDARNAGIQFRSKPINDTGQALGYQADVGEGVWGKLYHEHGRGKLDWNNRADGAVKTGEWNKYEILAVGHRIWTAINGKLCVAINDTAGELSGKIAFQIHGGPPQTVYYRNPVLTHDPKIELAGLNEKELNAKLPMKGPTNAAALPSKPHVASRWPRLIAAVDPGSQTEAWAKPAFDHSKWRTMTLPGHFDDDELPGFDGVVWLRTTVEVSAEQAKAAATLHLGQIDDMDVSWVNGRRVGGYENPGHHYTVRKYQVPAGVLMPGKNTIAVRVMDHGSLGGIAGKPEQLALQLGNERISLANRWHFNPGANLAALNEHASLIGPKPGWTAELTAWRAKLDGNDAGIKGKWFDAALDDAKWKTMSLPSHYEDRGLKDFDGAVWFRKTVEIRAEAVGKDHVLELGPIDDMDMTFFNGKKVGGIEKPGFWAAARGYKVPAALVKAGRNVITVRVMDHGWSGGFAGNARQMKLTGNGTATALAGEWRYQPGVSLQAIGLGPLTNPTTTAAAPAAAVAEVSALVRPLVRPTIPVEAFASGFAIDSDQMIAILGGTNALESGRRGYLETLLTAAHSQHRVRLRNLAWQADTVYQQQRPRNFYASNKPDYGERDGRIQIKADIIFFWMGQVESLDGLERIDEFTAAYSQHLDQIAEYTKRIVLVTPVPFSNPLNLEIDMKTRRESLAVYADAIRKIARDRKLAVVDLSKAFGSGDTPLPHSQNGLHLSAAGHWDAAREFASQLGFAERVASIKWYDSDASLEPASAETLRQAIEGKNDLWFRYWRPTNWAFLYGNRQQTASSRDHTNPSHRWFPEELQKALNHLDSAEQQVHEAVKARKK